MPKKRVSTPEIDHALVQIFNGGSMSLRRLQAISGISRRTLRRRACELGLSPPENPPSCWPERDAAVRAAFDKGSRSCAELQEQTGLSRKQVFLSLRGLGLRLRENRWTESQDDFLRSVSFKSAGQIHREFTKRFPKSNRTERAIRERLYRLNGTLLPDFPWYTTTQLAEALGKQVSTLDRWIEKERLKARRRDDGKYVIHHNWIRRALLERSIRVELDRLPPHSHDWFVDLISAPVNPHRESEAKGARSAQRGIENDDPDLSSEFPH